MTNEEKIKEIKIKYDDYDWLEYIDEMMKEYADYILQKAIESVPELEPHICRFNDGECKCDCFEECRTQTLANLNKLKE